MSTKINRLTLADLEAFDPHRPASGAEQPYRCPLGGACDGKSKRTLYANVDKGVFYCQRCGAKGRLGGEGDSVYVPPKLETPRAPSIPWQQRLASANLLPFDGSAGELYLHQRGIPSALAQACGVRFAGRFGRRAAVVFDLTNQHGIQVGVHGRFLDQKKPRMMSWGVKKAGVVASPGALQSDFVLVEAPIDGLTVLKLLRLPFVATCGSGLPDWVPAASAGRTVYVATDNDTQGSDDWQEWGPLLEAAGARIIRLAPPGEYKDWNAVIDRRK